MEEKLEYNRRALLSEVSFWNEKNNITNKFKKDFFSLIEECILELMSEDDNYFAYFAIQMKREIKLDLLDPVETKVEGNGFTLYFSPQLLLRCTITEMKALIKHEIYHILSKHLIRANALKNMYSKAAINLAMDISINEYIAGLPVWAETLESVRRSYNVELEENLSMEEYARRIQLAMDKLKKVKDPNMSHEMWWNSSEIVDNIQINEVTQRLANNAAKGKIPESVGKLLKSINEKSEIRWENYLKNIIGTVPSGYKKTITRKDRRQPYRLDLRGRLRNHITHIIVAIDISGSMTDGEIRKALIEVLSIVKNYHYEIKVIECDNDIRRIYNVRNIRDLREKLNTRGGTKFSPVFEYMMKNNMRDYCLIYFTDGIGEKSLSCRPVSYRNIWVLTGKDDSLSLDNPYGKVLKLSGEKKEEIDIIEYVRNEMRDIRGEWAK